MFIAVLASLVFSGVTYAQDLNQISKVLQAPIAPTLECTPDTLDKNILKECALKLCGKPGSLPSSRSNGDELKGFKPSKEVQEEIDRSLKLVSEGISSWKSTAIYELKNFKSSLAVNPKATNPSLQNVEKILNSYVSYKVVEDKIKIIPSLDKNADPKLKEGIAEWVRAKEKEIQTDPILRLRMGLDSPVEAMQFLSVKYKALKDEVLKLPANDTNRRQIENTYSLVEPVFTQVHEGAVEGVSDFIKRASLLISPPDFSKTYKFNIHDPACKEKCLEGLKPLLAKEALEEAVDKASIRIAKEEARYLTACRTGFELQAKLGQLPGQRKKATGLLDKALNSVTAQAWWSSHTKAAFREFVQKQAKVAESFASKDIVNSENMNNILERERQKFAPDSIVDTLESIRNYPGNIFASAIPFCPSPSNLTTDSFQYSIEKPLLHISSYSCEHQGTGEGIIAHELGHGLSAFMRMGVGKSPESEKTYKKIRSCINSSNPSVSMNIPEDALLPFSGDRLTTEEDTADWILNKSVKTKVPIGCAILDVTEGEYEGLDLSPMKADTHSSSLLRAIRQVHAQTGSLPSACQQALNAYKGIVEVKTCDF